MKKYQTIIIFTPNATDGIIDKTLQQIQEKHKLTRIDKWGVKKMSYEVRQQSSRILYRSGNHVCANIEGEDKELDQLKKELNKDPNIIKFILVRTGG